MGIARVLPVTLRLLQFTSAIIAIGDLGYEITSLHANSIKAPNCYVYTLFICCVALVTSIIWILFDGVGLLVSLWDIMISMALFIATVWIFMNGQPVRCTMNPYGASHCSRIKAAVAFVIVSVILWLLSGVIGCFIYVRRRVRQAKEEAKEEAKE
ncbi:hypothetical protein V1511DRAFT_496761 [Dipodascopsis uninucleata]